MDGKNCDISYDKRIEDPDTYFSNLDPMDCDIMIARHYRLRNDVAFTYLNFSGVLEKYNYFRELIESDPDYEEYRRTHTFIAR